MENFSGSFLGEATLNEGPVEWFSHCGGRSTIIVLGTVDGSPEDTMFVNPEQMSRATLAVAVAAPACPAVRERDIFFNRKRQDLPSGCIKVHHSCEKEHGRIDRVVGLVKPQRNALIGVNNDRGRGKHLQGHLWDLQTRTTTKKGHACRRSRPEGFDHNPASKHDVRASSVMRKSSTQSPSHPTSVMWNTIVQPASYDGLRSFSCPI
jgi:hypothetical protein